MLLVIEERLRRSENMAGGMQRDGAIGGKLFGLIERQNVLDALARQACPHQASGAGGAKNFAMGGGVIRMRVRNEGARNGEVRVEPPIDLGKVNALVKLNVPSHASCEAAKDAKVQGNASGGDRGEGEGRFVARKLSPTRSPNRSPNHSRSLSRSPRDETEVKKEHQNDWENDDSAGRHGGRPFAAERQARRHCRYVNRRRTITGSPSFFLLQGSSSNLPVVVRLSSARWASAAAVSGNVAPIRTFNSPASTQRKRSSARFCSSSRVVV